MRWTSLVSGGLSLALSPACGGGAAEAEPNVVTPAEIQEWMGSPAAQAAGPETAEPDWIHELGTAPLGTAIDEVLSPLTEWEGVTVQVREAKHANGRLRYRRHVMLAEDGGEVDHGPDWRV